MKKAEVLNTLQRNDVFPDKFIQKKDGSFEYRRGYFYRMGVTTESCINAIKKVFPQAVIIEAYDNFQAWPKDSYFMVRFKLP